MYEKPLTHLGTKQPFKINVRLNYDVEKLWSSIHMKTPSSSTQIQIKFWIEQNNPFHLISKYNTYLSSEDEWIDQLSRDKCE